MDTYPPLTPEPRSGYRGWFLPAFHPVAPYAMTTFILCGLLGSAALVWGAARVTQSPHSNPYLVYWLFVGDLAWTNLLVVVGFAALAIAVEARLGALADRLIARGYRTDDETAQFLQRRISTLEGHLTRQEQQAASDAIKRMNT